MCIWRLTTGQLASARVRGTLAPSVWSRCPPPGEALSLPVREKPRVLPAVVAHGQCAMTKVDNLHHVRMTALLAECVIVVAPVRRLGSARCHLRQIPSLIHDPVPPHSFAVGWRPRPAQKADAAT